MRIPTTSDIGHWSRDGGIPRFINLPPSPFRENDRGILYIALSFTYWHKPKSGAEGKRKASVKIQFLPPLCKGRWVGASRAGGIVWCNV